MHKKRKVTPGLLHRRSSTSREWLGVHWGSGDLLSRVHLVSRLLVHEMACGFIRFESDIATSQWHMGGFAQKKDVFAANWNKSRLDVYPEFSTSFHK